MADGEAVAQMVAWQRDQVATLAPREREVAQLAACGLRNHEIARAMAIEPTTVRTYLQWIFVKLQVRSRAQLVVVALLTDLVDVEMVVRAWQEYAPEVIGCD